MKATGFNSMRKLLVALASLLLINNSFVSAQTAPDLKSAEHFSILSGTDIATIAQISTKRDAGAVDSLSTNVIAEGMRFESGDCIVAEAQTDLVAAKQQLEAQAGTQLTSSISNTTLSPGVYESLGSLDISGTVTLNGTVSDVFIFNISDQLTLSSSAKIELVGVSPENVFFNVDGATYLDANSEMSGVLLSKKAITCEVGVSGEMRLLCEDSITVKEPGAVVGIERPTQPSIDLGTASSFALLAALNISDSDTVGIFGDMGAFKGVISNQVSASGTTFPANSCEVQKALSDLSFAFNSAFKLPGTNISGNIGGQAYVEGVYEVSGNAILNGTLSLTGTTSSIYIFRITDQLTVDPGAIMVMGNVMPENVYWVVGNNTTIGKDVNFSGMVISRGDIVKEGTNRGLNSFLSLQGSIELSDNRWLPYLTYITSRDEATEPIPLIKLETTACGATNVDLGQLLKTETNSKATEYELLVENSLLGFSESVAIGFAQAFSLSRLGDAIEPFTTYDIRVRTKIGTRTGTYGQVCQVTTGSRFVNGKLWVTVLDTSATPVNGSRSGNTGLNQIFDGYNVTSYTPVFPFAKTPALLEVYEILCDCDQTQLKAALEQDAPNLLTGVHQRLKPIALYDPADHFWQKLLAGDDWVWYLEKIQANLAWDITLGDPDVKIAVIDNQFDITHPDLATKINPSTDPYTGVTHTYNFSANNAGHGTSTASLAGGETIETGGTPAGQSLSTGFKCEVLAYNWNNSVAKALHASNVMGADVVSISFYYGCNASYPGAATDQLAIQEVLDNGTAICSAAGNGPGNCNGGPIFPFSAQFDDRIIKITSTDRNDNHTAPGGGTTHSNYPAIDLCAPGYSIMAAIGTIDKFGTPSVWPYYGNGWGTSLATPIVAGVCGLMKSVNPCLRSEDVEAILKATTDPITDAASYPGEVGTGRVNAYQAVLLAQTYSTTNPNITANTDWLNDEFITGDINIEAGATLTISATVFMSEDARINVKRGAKLVIDGGTITTSCPKTWHGIEVWGNSGLAHPALSQVTNGNYPATSTDHGVLIIKDDALIEHMHNGISTHRRDMNFNAVWGYTGGIIVALNSTFRNNSRAVEFMAFTSSDNISLFKECTFETTDALLEAGLNPSAFVTLWEVNGVRFLGNEFKNTTSGIYDYDKRGRGIFSADAGYIVEPYCDLIISPCEVENRFEGLFRGIEALACIDPWKYIRIEENKFENNLQGILIGGMYNSEILNNQYEIGNFINNIDYPYGLYLNGATGYWVEANEFTSFDIQSYTTGAYVRNSGDDFNEIYANEFDNVHGGTVALDDNDGVVAMDGLHLKCNDNTNNRYDMVVRDGDIAYLQGFCGNNADPAGNLFSHTCQTSNSEIYVGKPSSQLIHYFHHDESASNAPYNRTEPQCYNTTYVNPINCVGLAFDPTTSCSTPFGGGCGGFLPCAKTAFDGATAQLVQLSSQIDGGNSQVLKDAINNTSIVPEGQLKNLLINASPLSDEVLIEFINRTVAPVSPGVVKDVLNENAPISTEVSVHLFDLSDPLPAGIFKEIMIASSPLTNMILDKINNMEPPLPNGILNNIMKHQNDPFVVSSRQQILWEFAAVGSQRARILAEIIHIYLRNDSIGGLDSIIVLLEEEGTTSAKEKLVSAYNKKGDFTKAQQTINELALLPEYDEFVKLQLAIINILQNSPNKQLFDLSGANEQIFRNVAAQDGSIGSVNAQAGLEFVFNEIYPEKFFLPDMQNNLKMAGNSDAQQEIVDFGIEEMPNIQYEGYRLSNYPNPFSDGTIIGAYIPNSTSESEVIIYNVVGNIVGQYELKGGNNFIEIGSDDIDHGIYFYTLISSGSKVATKKMIHLK